MLIALLLVTLSASLHAGWNIMLKKSAQQEGFMWWMLFSSGVMTLPITAWYIWSGDFSMTAAGYAMAGGSLIGAYSVTLALGYTYLPLSLVYPTSRGVGAVLALAAGVWILSDPVSAGGLAGVGVILLGMVVTSKASEGGERKRWSLIILPVITGVCIAGYHLVDSVGVASASPVAYAPVEMTTAWLCYTLWLKVRGRLSHIVPVWKSEGGRAILSGMASFWAYVLVLFALQLEHVGYIVAARNISLVFGAIAGVWIFREGFAIRRILGAALVTFGVFVMGWSGNSSEQPKTISKPQATVNTRK